MLPISVALQLLGCLVFALVAVVAVATKQWLYPIVTPYYLSLILAGFAFVGSLMHKVGARGAWCSAAHVEWQL
jgi:uncharacterized membrane protein